MAKSKIIEPTALDPHHPVVRRMMRRLQLFAKKAIEHCRAHGGQPPRLALLVEAGALLTDICGHIRTAAPRIEYDEAAQERIMLNGECIGRLSRPAAFPSQLLPMIEAAIEAHLDGHQVDGDADAAAECAPSDIVGLIEVES